MNEQLSKYINDNPKIVLKAVRVREKDLLTLKTILLGDKSSFASTMLRNEIYNILSKNLSITFFETYKKYNVGKKNCIINFNIEEEVLMQFNIWCNENNIKESDMIRLLIDKIIYEKGK